MVDMAGAQRGLEHNLDSAWSTSSPGPGAWGVLVGACRLDASVLF
jgi:hypothetical protein